MSVEPIFCPRCGSPGGPGLRYCRQCGTDLASVASSLNTRSTDGMWLFARGILSIVLSLPLFFVLLISLGDMNGAGIAVSLAVQAVMLTFAFLGVRDLRRLYTAGRTAQQQLEQRDQVQLNPPPSIVEHTTYPLDAVHRARDTNET